jgi:hypothetical protein
MYIIYRGPVFIASQLLPPTNDNIAYGQSK